MRIRFCAGCKPVELLLQALIGVVNAQLLEAVLLEALEAVDVQNAEADVAGALVASSQRHIDLVHQPPARGRGTPVSHHIQRQPSPATPAQKCGV